MTASVNKTVLIGNLDANPELRKTNNGKLVTPFSVATHGVLTDDTGASWEHTQWHSVVTQGTLAKRCQAQLRKGRQVYVEGSMYSRSYPDKEGKLREVWELLAHKVQFLGSGTPKSQGSESEPWPVGSEEDHCSELLLKKAVSCLYPDLDLTDFIDWLGRAEVNSHPPNTTVTKGEGDT